MAFKEWKTKRKPKEWKMRIKLFQRERECMKRRKEDRISPTIEEVIRFSLKRVAEEALIIRLSKRVKTEDTADFFPNNVSYSSASSGNETCPTEGISNHNCILEPNVFRTESMGDEVESCNWNQNYDTIQKEYEYKIELMPEEPTYPIEKPKYESEEITSGHLFRRIETGVGNYCSVLDQRENATIQNGYDEQPLNCFVPSSIFCTENSEHINIMNTSHDELKLGGKRAITKSSNAGAQNCQAKYNIFEITDSQINLCNETIESVVCKVVGNYRSYSDKQKNPTEQSGYIDQPTNYIASSSIFCTQRSEKINTGNDELKLREGKLAITKSPHAGTNNFQGKNILFRTTDINLNLCNETIESDKTNVSSSSEISSQVAFNTKVDRGNAKTSTPERQVISTTKYHSKVNSTLVCSFCAYKAGTLTDLKKHKKTVHDKILDKNCKFCSYSTSRQDNLSRHVKNMHGNEMFCCQFCSFKCSRKDNHKTHVKIWHLQKEDPCYPCSQCNSTYFYKQSLDRHIKNDHIMG